MMPVKHLLISAAIGLAMWAALFWGIDKARADHEVCPRLEVPIVLDVRFADDPAPWVSWSNYLNAKAGTDIVEIFEPGGPRQTAYVFPLRFFYGNPAYHWLTPGITQVIPSCTLTTPVILEGPETDNWKWAGHELMHLFGFGDHIYWNWAVGGLNGQNWIDPRVCDVPSSPLYSNYDGVLSYCSHPSTWFLTPDDVYLLGTVISGW